MQFQLVELFSGKGEVSRTFMEAGKSVSYFDRVHDNRAMNIESPAGMAFFVCNFSSCNPTYLPMVPLAHHRLCLSMVLAMAPNSLLVLAPECSSWTVVSRGTSRRSAINFWGDMSTAFVRKANMMMSRNFGYHSSCGLAYDKLSFFDSLARPPIIHGWYLRMSALLLVAMAVRAIFVMEQPRSCDPIFSLHHRFAWFCNHVCYVPWLAKT